MASDRNHPRPKEVAREVRTQVTSRYQEDVDPTHRSLLRAWFAFAITFGLARATTYGIKHHFVPNMNVASEGLHIHHFVWGIGLLLLVGCACLIDDKARFHRPISIAYGIGVALIVDEFALLLNLRDVYWQKEGRTSVDVALGIFIVFGIYLSAARFWHDMAKDVGRFLRWIAGRSPLQ